MKQWESWRLAVLAFGFFTAGVLAPGNAHAMDYTWYADAAATGNGSATNWANASTTIQGAIDAATAWLIANHSGTRANMSPSDALYIVVRAGTYSETVYPGRKDTKVDNGLAGTTNGAPLYIQSEYWDVGGKTNTIVVNPGGKGTTFWPWSGAGGTGGLGYFTIRGFTIRSDAAVYSSGGTSAVLDYAAGYATYEHNIVELVNGNNQSWYGILSSSFCTIRHNIVRTVGASCSGSEVFCLVLRNDNVVHGNTLYMAGTGAAPQIFRSDNPCASRNVVSGNFFISGPGCWASVNFMYGGATWVNATNVFSGNVFVNGPRAILLGAEDVGNVFYNNTLYSGGNFLSSGSADTAFNNLLVGSFYASGVFYEGAYNEATDAIDALGNYVRAPVGAVADTTLPAGYLNMLPSEIYAANPDYLRPTGFIAGAKMSHEGFARLEIGINELSTHTAQLGAAFWPEPPLGTVVLIR